MLRRISAYTARTQAFSHPVGSGSANAVTGHYLPGGLAKLRVWAGAMTADQVNSQIAAAYFNKVARERGLNYKAVSRGIDMYWTIPVVSRMG